MNQRERIALALRSVKSLPTLPDVAMRLLETTDDPNVSTREIAATVERDMSLASRVLKLVNSPFFGIQREINSVQQALIVVGMSNLRSLVLSSAVLDLFDRDGSVGNFKREDFWTHCVAVAATARTLARKTRIVDPDIAFTAGLLHDMGKVVVDRYLHTEFKQIVELLDDEAMHMTDAEQKILGVNHAELGQHLAVLWNLPEMLREAVGYHHNPLDAPENPNLAALISVSDILVRRLKVGNGGGADHPLDPAIFRICGLKVDQFQDLMTDLAEVLEEQVTEFSQV